MSKEIEKRKKDEIPFTKKDQKVLQSILKRYPYPPKQLTSKEKK